MKAHLKNFLAGFISTLIFHQGSVAILHAVGAFPAAPYNFAPTQPFGVPAVVSLSFFGGLWGILIGWMLRHERGSAFWWKAFLYGAIGPTAVAFAVVFPLKGLPFKPQMIPFGLFLNGMWGVGTGCFMRAFSKGPITT